MLNYTLPRIFLTEIIHNSLDINLFNYKENWN